MKLKLPLLPKSIRWLFVLGIAGFIFYVSIVTVPPETVLDTAKPDLLPLDKWRHFLAYAAFGGSLAYAWADSNRPLHRTTLLILALTITYGVGIEFGQSTIPNRYFSLGDAYANALGGVLIAPWYVIRPHLEFLEIATWFNQISENR